MSIFPGTWYITYMTHSGALLYVRKSTVEVEQRSLDQQELACRDLAQRLGLPVLGVVAEEASAYAERERPKFVAALQRAASERLVVVTWAIDRFSRRGAEAVLPLLKTDSPLRLVTVEGDDTSDERQRLIIIIKAEMALQYSTQLGRNVRRAREAARKAGLWAGAEPPYGYLVAGSGKSRRLVLHETEAQVIRELAACVELGSPYYSLAMQLNKNGVPSPRGQTWTAVGVKRVLYNPAIAGFHARNRLDMVRDDKGHPVQTHEPIIPHEMWERLRAKIDRKRRTSGRPTKALLSGILRCSCGYKLGSNATSGPKGAWYRCMGPRDGSRVHPTIQQAPADIAATDLVLGRIIWLGTLEPDHPTFLRVAETWGALTGESEDQTQRATRTDVIDAARAKLERTARREAEGLLDEKTAGNLLREYKQELVIAETRLAELGPTKIDAQALLDTTRESWEPLPLERKRLVIKSVIEAIDLLPGRGSATQRLRPDWVE